MIELQHLDRLGEAERELVQDALRQRACARPVRVVTSLGIERWVACGTRFRDRCAYCASLVEGDWARILRSGTMDIPADIYELLGDTTLVLLTLTAPSFGSIHRVPREGGAPARCKCGAGHVGGRDDHLRGVPVEPLAYDYDSQVRWNYSLGRLWDRTRTNIRRLLPGTEYAVVREWQKRGVLHLHVLLRVPTPGRSLDLTRLVEVASASSTTVGGHRIAWGKQVDGRVVHREGESTGRTLRYLAKMLGYMHKSIADDWSPESLDHQRRLDLAAREMRCDACPSTPRRCASPAHHRTR
jgi:hypothetical protein